MAEQRPTPEQEARRLYEDAEAKTAAAMEQLVGREAFGELLAKMTENVVALTKIGNDVLDLAVRNLRVASRRDIARLGAQMARTEDKLELVLQEVEALRAEREERPVARRRGGGTSGNGASGPASSRTRRARSTGAKS